MVQLKPVVYRTSRRERAKGTRVSKHHPCGHRTPASELGEGRGGGRMGRGRMKAGHSPRGTRPRSRGVGEELSVGDGK